MTDHRAAAEAAPAGDAAPPAPQPHARDWLQALALAGLTVSIGMLALLAGSLIRALLVVP